MLIAELDDTAALKCGKYKDLGAIADLMIE